MWRTILSASAVLTLGCQQAEPANAADVEAKAGSAPQVPAELVDPRIEVAITYCIP
jgi:hypothetical protein